MPNVVRYTKDTTIVGPPHPQSPSPHQQMPPKIQVAMQHQPPPIQMPLAAHMQSIPKSALVVNIPSSSPLHMPATQSPRLVQATTPAIKHHQQMPPMEQQPPQISISASAIQKHHGPPMHHIKTIQSAGMESRQSPSAHANQAMLVQMSVAQQVQMQHMPQSQNIVQSKSAITGHPLNMQSQGQPSPPTFVQHLPQMPPFTTTKVSQSRAHQLSMSMQPQPIVTAQHMIPTPPQSHGKSTGKQQLPPQQQQQIMTGAVASPPPKQPHLNSQQPIVTGNLAVFDEVFSHTVFLFRL